MERSRFPKVGHLVAAVALLTVACATQPAGSDPTAQAPGRPTASPAQTSVPASAYPTASTSPGAAAGWTGRIAVVVGEPDGTRILILDGGQPDPVRVVETADSPAWSPDGRMLAYSCRYDADRLPGLCLVAVDDPGSVAQLLLPEVISVTWAPTGDVLMLGRSAVDFGDTVAASPDGTTLFGLSVPGAETRADIWSPDGSHVAGSASPGGVSAPVVAVCRIEDRMCAGFGSGSAEGWSLDGRRIAFIGGEAGSLDALALDPATAVVSTLLDLDASISGVAWSVDDRLAVVAEDGSLRVVDAVGGEPRRLAEDLRLVGRPAWSPDGRWIAVRAEAGAVAAIFVIPADGGDPIRLTAEASAGSFAWDPSR